VPAWLHLSHTYLTTQRFKGAIHCLEQVLLIRGVQDKLLLTRIAECYYSMKEWRIACKYYSQVCILEGGGGARAVWGLFLAAKQLGNLDMAKAAGVQLTKIYSGGDLAQTCKIFE
jgi:tetratricopeptide (TPR) repeat protein